ncbi:MAG TPA: PHP domain-containing protein [Bacteroidales bacterium]|nr:PHP domain-containing protein [Bacteroidales bacterium]HOS71647.1 PHP domain-containing protein [Bacteroidales bacterium]HQH23861.1 PHP domain-containing protein [Bacteroidales bacterium]HQJ83157.1 PHP domain-containing protein [Bacteroidales bacterium]
MKKNFLENIPWHDELTKKNADIELPDYREANAHIHTPYSFSSFDSMDTLFRQAREEEIAVLGINDFFVADGYETFHNGCVRNRIFPLFNIEFIGLLKEEQKKGIRINDPNNPGRIYLCGKGLDYPFSLNWWLRRKLKNVIRENQNQIKAMIDRLNRLIEQVNPALVLSYGEIRTRFAKNLVRERHLAKALRSLAVDNYEKAGDQVEFIESLYNGKKVKAAISDQAAMENEIRSNLLKAGGPAFVGENEKSFPSLEMLIRIIIKAGGIPCYPVLLDDASGKLTEFEADMEKLYSSLSSAGIGCIELIPSRNDPSMLENCTEYFNEKGFIVTFGTEHNTPDLAPLAITSRGSIPLKENLRKTAWEGACVIAAHQYLRTHGRQGYVLDDGTLCVDQKNDLAALGRNVIEYFLNNSQHESGNKGVN